MARWQLDTRLCYPPLKCSNTTRRYPSSLRLFLLTILLVEMVGIGTSCASLPVEIDFPALACTHPVSRIAQHRLKTRAFAGSRRENRFAIGMRQQSPRWLQASTDNNKRACKGRSYFRCRDLKYPTALLTCKLPGVLRLLRLWGQTHLSFMKD